MFSVENASLKIVKKLRKKTEIVPVSKSKKHGELD